MIVCHRPRVRGLMAAYSIGRPVRRVDLSKGNLIGNDGLDS
jgi:hypothetical protein